jgi:hypothetical protein
MSSYYISGLIEEIHTEGNNLPDDVFQDDKARRRLQAAAFKLLGALETPIDGVRRIIFQVVSPYFVLSWKSHPMRYGA